nr:hypothetical protein [Verrucomicrobiota bacterium]
MKHSGKARKAGLKLIALSLPVLAAIGALGFLVPGAGRLIIPAVAGVWLVFALFTLFFFRDPTPRAPAGAGLVLAAAHGTVDALEAGNEPEVMGGQCQRVSI